MQTLLNISLQEDNTLLVTSDVFQLETKDENTLVNWARRHTRAQDYKSLHPVLLDYLVQWRRDKARELNLSAFVILTNRTLWAISDAAPTSREALLDVPGMGPGRFESYGEEILALVDQALADEGTVP
jgi:ribonuclease D